MEDIPSNEHNVRLDKVEISPQPSNPFNKHISIPLWALTLIIFVLLAGYFYTNSHRSKPADQLYELTPTQLVEPYTTPEPTTPVNDFQTSPISTPSSGISEFTRTIDLPAVGIKANFPPNVNVSLQEESFYVVSLNDNDAVTFQLAQFNGGGRRAWFLKEYPWAQNYQIEPYTGNGHNGYIAYATQSEDQPGTFVYFTQLKPKSMLIVRGFNYISNNQNPTLGNNSVFFTSDISKFKNFLSTIEPTTIQKITLETNPTIEDLFRSSDIRKTIWEDTSIGLKITAPEWIESRQINGRDSNGKYIYSEWGRTTSEARIYQKSSIYSQSDPRIEVNSSPYLALDITDSNGRTPIDFINEYLIPAGFCASEFKPTKSECASYDYCYTRDEVIQNLVVKKQIKIGSLDAQLRHLNQEFSDKNDCRSIETWVIQAKNGKIVVSTISPEGESTRLEATN